MDQVWGMLALLFSFGVIAIKVALGHRVGRQKGYVQGISRDKDKLLKQLYVLKKQRQSAEIKLGAAKRKKKKLQKKKAQVAETLNGLLQEDQLDD